MLNSLELENWKTHGLTSVHFSKGTNILIGQMGAGKSSVLDAVSFALFGTFPNIKNRRVKIDDIIRNKPEQKRSATVRLSFDADGTDYVVERNISLDNPAKATLKKNGVFLQSQPQRVTEEIEKVLKIDYDLFARAVYSEQNRLDYFLELGASERKNQIDNLLGLDRFAAAQDNAGSLITRIKGMVEDSEKVVKSFDIKKMTEQRDALASELSRIENENTAVESSLLQLRSSKTAAEAQLTKLKAQLDKRIRLEREVAEARSRISVIEKEMSSIEALKLPNLDDLKRGIGASELRHRELRAAFDSCSEALQALQGSSGRLQKELLDIEKNRKEKAAAEEKMRGKTQESLKAPLDAAAKELEGLDAQYAHAIALSKEAEKSIAELSKHIAKCPICDSELTAERKDFLINSKGSSRKQAEADAAVALRLRSALREKIAALNSELNMFVVLNEKIRSLGDLDAMYAKASGESAGLSAKITKAKASFTQANDRIATESEVLSGLKASKEQAERLLKYDAERKKYALLLGSKELELSATDVDSARVEDAQKLHTRISSEHAEANARLEAGRAAYSEKKSQVQDKEQEIAKIRAVYEELKAKKLSVDDLSRFRNALAETQSVLRKRLVNSINEIMQGIWPELYPYGDYTGIALSASDSDYELQLKAVRGNAHVWESVNATASGGERSIACMAMRIAFSLVLVPNLRWLILDEPTHNIDQQGIAKLVRLLNEGLPNIVEQIFIITHDEQLKQVSNGRIYSLTRNKDENKETVINEL